MSKAKIAKKSTAIDMTPMVDLAFLLITFFMLTVKFRPTESVEITTPGSTAETPIPAADIMTISISKDGRVFFAVDAQSTREGMVKKMAQRYDIALTEEELKRFKVQADVGVPIFNMKEWLAMDAEKRKEVAKGVPVDTVGGKNELADWIIFARLSNPKLKIAVKGDVETPYGVVRNVIGTLQSKRVNINKFNLITSAEAAPAATDKK